MIQESDVYCIVGNVIDRQPENGGNGAGYQQDLSYTLTAMDRHAVYARQRVDEFKDDDIASTQSARQSKDATDLVIVSTRSSSADSPHWNVSACKGFWMTGQISPARRTRQDIARWAILLPSRVWSSLCEA